VKLLPGVRLFHSEIRVVSWSSFFIFKFEFVFLCLLFKNSKIFKTSLTHPMHKTILLWGANSNSDKVFWCVLVRQYLKMY
jgi:hypothetical protein